MSDDQKSQEQGNQSEVARLRKLIDQEQQAARRGLYGLTAGTAKHEFITKRMENMGKIHQELEKIIGAEEAARIIVEHMNKEVTKDPKGENDAH